jgi:ParB/RepB/Spo0J family partition protein
MSDKKRSNMSVVSRVIAGGMVSTRNPPVQDTPLPSSDIIKPPIRTNFVQTKSTGIGERMRELDPNECRLWKYADRPENEALHAQDLANEFLSGVGQLHPAIVREVSPSDVDYPRIKYEIIAGSVRWRASKIAGRNLKAVIRELNDKEAVTIMLSENEARKNISEFSRAKQIGLVWNSGIYESKGEAADAHRMAAGKFSQYLKVYDHHHRLKAIYGEQVSEIGLRNLYEATLSLDEGQDDAILSEQNTVANLREARGKTVNDDRITQQKEFLSYRATKKATSFFVQTKLTEEQARKVNEAIKSALKELGVEEE